jgi:ATP-dependent RNA helicase DOB1
MSSVSNQNEESSFYKVFNIISERNMAPVIVFSFSIKECEENGSLVGARFDLNTKDEKRLVEEVFKKTINILSKEDKNLSQVKIVLPLLRKGIGKHHSDLLPILKETFEIFFSQGFLKALFVTETFSTSLNMVARTVIFTACRKFKYDEMRLITSHEYIQKCEYVGRRCLDNKGIIIMMIDEKMSTNEAKDIYIVNLFNFLI